MTTRADTLFGYLARDSRPPDWRESARTAFQIWVLGLAFLVVTWCERNTSRSVSAILVLVGIVYNVAVAGRLALTSASFSAYLTAHIERFDLIRVSLLSDADVIRTLLHVTFYHNRRSLAEACGALSVVWMALVISTYWQLEPASNPADYRNNAVVALIIVLGLWLLHPVGALVGIFSSLIGKRGELAVAAALLLFIITIFVLLTVFASVTPFETSRILPPISAVLTCLVPPGVLIVGGYAVVYGLLRRR